jgi:hypothetical protein
MQYNPMIRIVVLVCLAINSGSLAIAQTEVPPQTATEPLLSYLKYAEFAAAAYKSVDDFTRIGEEYKFEFTHTGANTADKVRYFIATNDDDKSQIIAVRGTSNVENAMVDIDYVLIPDETLGIELHKGFAQSSQNIYQELKTKLNKDYTIHITGHSLGGAVAVILAMYLDKQGFTMGDIVTFGQPKLTNRTGAKTFQHLNVVRVNNLMDMVPTVPPFDASQIMNFKLDIFWHLGKEYVLLSDHYYSVLDGLDSLLRGADFLSQTPTAENITAHQIDTYIQRLENLINQGKEIPFNKRDEYLQPTKPDTINPDTQKT